MEFRSAAALLSIKAPVGAFNANPIRSTPHNSLLHNKLVVEVHWRSLWPVLLV